MKKFLLPEAGTFYKANLHCHTNISDGNLSPEEVKKLYMENGYSIVAFTDHDVMLPHPELCEENFLPLTGYELEIREGMENWYIKGKRCHMCFIAIEPETEKQVCFHREKYFVGNGEKYKHLAKFDESLPDYKREYSAACVCDMIQKGRKAGFFVTYNHPAWSEEKYPDYMQYDGMHAMEICNYGTLVMGYDEDNSKIYDDMLRGGKRLFCIGTDDNHNKMPWGTRGCDSCGAFTMIKAEKLEYKTITAALVNGDFYASQGPEITSLWFEDGEIHVTVPRADRIVLRSGGHYTGIAFAEEGKPLTKASFPVREDVGYVRLMVFDEKGRYAATNAYFVDDLFA